MTGKQIGYGIAGTAIAGLGAYFVYLQFFAKDKEIVAASVVNTPKVVATKAVAAVKAAVTPKRTTTGFTPPAPASTSNVRKMGDKGFAGKSGADAYKSASASTTNIYKYFEPGKYIGTFLATDGSFTKMIVEEDGLFSNTNVTVWVPTKDLTF